MRYTLVVMAALALAVAPSTSHAQDIGVVGGLSFGNVSNSGVLPGDVGVRTGFTAGISAFTPDLLSLLSIGVQGLYSQRGVSSKSSQSARKLEYLDFPLLARVKLPSPGIQPFAYAGPQFSYEAACNSGSGKCPKGNRPKTPWAGVIGAGVRFGGMRAVSLEARYIYGLQDLHLDTVTSPESYRERSFIILAGVTF